jgi:phage terminase large subunit
MKVDVDIYNNIGKSYYEVFEDAYYNKHVHYWLKGGRGSLKSSFVFIYIIYMMTIFTMMGHTVHCVAMRKVKETISGSIFTNFLWAINLLGLQDYWTYTMSPMIIKLGESTIIFRGCHNKTEFERIKSIKFEKGFCRYAVFEELTEFTNYDEILIILQSLFRGGDFAQAFYMYNPPASKFNWVNMECKAKIPNRFVHSSTYVTAPLSWLGNIFVEEAKLLQEINPRKYNHMYMGEEIGEGLEIYPNVVIAEIPSQKIETFDKINRGLDFGFSVDASSYVENFFDARHDDLYIFDEIYGIKMNNKLLADSILAKAGSSIIKADSAEPRTINELRILHLNVIGAKKGKDSVDHGIQWLQNLNHIYIDRKRCPYTAIDMETYEYKKDSNNVIIRQYPKEPHASAATRYSLDDIILSRKLVFGGDKNKNRAKGFS